MLDQLKTLDRQPIDITDKEQVQTYISYLLRLCVSLELEYEHQLKDLWKACDTDNIDIIVKDLTPISKDIIDAVIETYSVTFNNSVNNSVNIQSKILKLLENYKDIIPSDHPEFFSIDTNNVQKVLSMVNYLYCYLSQLELFYENK